MLQKYLIAGLGNPEKRYEKTRHNIGFEVVKHLASKHNIEFTEKKKVRGLMSSFSTDKEKIYLLMPLTYMNDSGISVRLAADFYEIPLANILIIVDDVAIDLGEFRIKTGSGTGGHNGLKSVEQHLRTNDYPRLKIGVGKNPGNLSDYVLGKFTVNEQKTLPGLIEKASGFVEIFIKYGLTEAMNKANIRAKKIQNEETINDQG